MSLHLWSFYWTDAAGVQQHLISNKPMAQEIAFRVAEELGWWPRNWWHFWRPKHLNFVLRDGEKFL